MAMAFRSFFFLAPVRLVRPSMRITVLFGVQLSGMVRPLSVRIGTMVVWATRQVGVALLGIRPGVEVAKPQGVLVPLPARAIAATRLACMNKR